MDDDELFARVRALLIDEFEIAPEAITQDARTREDLQLDSLDHVDLVVELERFVGRRIESEELETLLTVGDVVELLRRSLAGSPVDGLQSEGEPGNGDGVVPHVRVDAD